MKIINLFVQLETHIPNLLVFLNTLTEHFKRERVMFGSLIFQRGVPAMEARNRNLTSRSTRANGGSKGARVNLAPVIVDVTWSTGFLNFEKRQSLETFPRVNIIELLQRNTLKLL